MSLLETQDLSVRYGEKTILDGVTFSLNEGDWLMIVGPNGAGKSTIVNAVSQGVPYTGEVRVLDQDVRRYRAHELAKLVGVLAQTHAMGYGFTVGSVVRLGRYAYAPGLFSGGHTDDDDAVAQALSRPVLLIAQNEAAALRLTDDCATFTDGRSAYFPAETLTFTRGAASREVADQRLEALVDKQ